MLGNRNPKGYNFLKAGGEFCDNVLNWYVAILFNPNYALISVSQTILKNQSNPMKLYILRFFIFHFIYLQTKCALSEAVQPLNTMYPFYCFHQQLLREVSAVLSFKRSAKYRGVLIWRIKRAVIVRVAFLCSYNFIHSGSRD